MKFPVVGSCVLFGLFVAIKFVPKHWVDLIISLYFSAIGAYTIATLIEPATVPTCAVAFYHLFAWLGHGLWVLVILHYPRLGHLPGSAEALAARQRPSARVRPRVQPAVVGRRLADLHPARARLPGGVPRLRRRLLQNQVLQKYKVSATSANAMCYLLSLYLEGIGF
jgi:hypothetical protein